MSATSPSFWGTHFLYLSNPSSGNLLPIISCSGHIPPPNWHVVCCVWTLSSITVTSPQLSSPWPQESNNQPIDEETMIRKVQTIRLRHAQLLVLIVIQSILVTLPIPSERHILTLMLWTSGVRWSRGLFVQEEESPWCCICSWSWTRCQWARVKSQAGC